MSRRPRVDLDAFPKAPTHEEWLKLSAAERRRVVDALPDEVTDAEMSPPEGDLHFWGKVSALDTLRSHFRRKQRAVYLACELPVYYPGERRFAPDLLAVVGAEDKERGKWVVDAEGQGLDVVMEVHVGGDRRKDAIDNVERYARLGIPEYFIFDRNTPALVAYRLASKGKKYVPIVPQHGRYRCERLGLDLQLENGKLRFFDGNALLLETTELAERLERMVDDLQNRLEEEKSRREEETRKREEETRKREEETRKREEETRKREEETRKREEAERKVAELERQLKKRK
ncbi:MAG: Uma2 family endonuclease [Myxococcales bacterium]|nr:Uma2 family endonuclease [Myxococcales bacterium]